MHSTVCVRDLDRRRRQLRSRGNSGYSDNGPGQSEKSDGKAIHEFVPLFEIRELTLSNHVNILDFLPSENCGRS